jgi:hypothetical protein
VEPEQFPHGIRGAIEDKVYIAILKPERRFVPAYAQNRISRTGRKPSNETK